MLKEIVELYRENFKANAANKTGRYLRKFIKALEKLADLLDETGQLKESVAVRRQLISERKESLQEDLDIWANPLR